MSERSSAFPYSHGRMTTVTTQRRIQQLPRGAVPRVAMGQTVKAMEIIAVLEKPEERRLIDVAKLLKVEPRDLANYVLKREGDLVSAGEALASRSGFLGLRKRRLISPFDGRIAWAGDGQLLLEGGRRRVEVMAAAPGRVTAIEPGEFIVLEIHGVVLEAAWGVGGLAWGTLKVMDGVPSSEAGRFNIDHRGSIVAIGLPLTEQVLKEAVDIRVKGLIAPSMHASLVPHAMNAGFPVALTKGFGHLPMSERILNLLNTHNGREISMDAPDPGDSREFQPEIIIPVSSAQRIEDRLPDPDQLALRVGHRVLVLQHPYLGDIGTITDIPDQPQQLPSGLWMQGAVVEVAPGKTVFVPFANLQHLG